MCTFCPIRKPPPKKAVRFDSYVDTFSISDASGPKVSNSYSLGHLEVKYKWLTNF